MAGGIPAPPDEVGEHAHNKVNSISYDVVWDEVGKKYVGCGDRVTVVEDLGGQHGVAVAAGEHEQEEGQHGLPDGGAADVGRVVDQVLAEGVTGTRSVMKAELRSCFEFKKKVVCTDFERNIYEVKSENFDWKVDEVCERKKTYDNKTST